MKYRLAINDVHHFPESSERLKDLLDFAKGQVYVTLFLTQIYDREPKLLTKLMYWVMRMDLASFNEGSELWALINENWAISFFHEKIDFARFKELQDIDITSFFFRSINPDYKQDDNRKVEFIVGAMDDPVRHPERNCLATDIVMNAFRSFYKTGVRPDCIDWEDMTWDDIIAPGT
jgi:hypothetical protein